MTAHAAPFYADVADAPPGARALWLSASDGARLRIALWPGGTRGTAVVFPGRTEYIEKYGRVAGRLVSRDLSVVVIDWRGQGLADRHPEKRNLGHVEDFRDYQCDVAAVLGCEEVAILPSPFHLIAHSMGGCIGLRTLLEGANFSSAIFTAPMWRLQMRAATREFANRVAGIAQILGLGTHLLPGTSKAPTTLDIAFEANVLTSDRDQFEWCMRQVAQHPELALGRPSAQWTYAALEEMARFYLTPMPELPALAFVGSEETVVSPSAVRSHMAKMPCGELVLCDGARHEIFMERPEIVDCVWAQIDRFLAEVAVRGRPAAVNR